MSEEIIVNHLIIHHWKRQENSGSEFSCGYGDCNRKIEHGESYYIELYPDARTLSY